jgi:hypothetical protein
MQEENRGELQVKPGENGTVEIAFKFEGRDVRFSLSADEVSGLSSHLLTAANATFINSGKSDEDAAAKFLGPITPPVIVPVSMWHFANTNVSGQRVILARVGEVAIAFSITPDRMRSFGRTIVDASWKTQTTATSLSLLKLVFTDFCSDLQAWAIICHANIKASMRRFGVSAWSRLSGRSLRIFRVIEISADSVPPNYSAVGKCVYCDAEIYSDREGIRRHPLGAEHIVAEGLGGDLELPEASCLKCEEITSAVEGGILGKTLKSLRIHLGIRSKKKRPAPKTLPLTKTNEGQQEETIEMPIADYPVILNMPAFGVPPVFFSGPGGNQVVYGFRIVILSFDHKKLLRDHGVGSFSSVPWDTHLFFRMLAKIGHSFAAAELGLRNFKPLLQDLILKGDPELFNHIGGEPDLARDPMSNAAHMLALGYQRANGKDYVVAKIRLFAKQSGPIYYVVVGESLERTTSKYERSFARRWADLTTFVQMLTERVRAFIPSSRPTP